MKKREWLRWHLMLYAPRVTRFWERRLRDGGRDRFKLFDSNYTEYEWECIEKVLNWLEVQGLMRLPFEETRQVAEKALWVFFRKGIRLGRLKPEPDSLQAMEEAYGERLAASEPPPDTQILEQGVVALVEQFIRSRQPREERVYLLMQRIIGEASYLDIVEGIEQNFAIRVEAATLRQEVLRFLRKERANLLRLLYDEEQIQGLEERYGKEKDRNKDNRSNGAAETRIPAAKWGPNVGFALAGYFAERVRGGGGLVPCPSWF